MWPVLKGLPEQRHPDLLIGYNQADDSGVVRLSDDVALIFTVDFFPAIVDDPYTFGQVTAANAMSDVYAMGGRPMSALNIVGFPEGQLPLEILGDLLRGGANKVNEAGAFIVGGHTVKDSELTYGLSVTGIVHPDNIIRINGARPGDVLVLTKPLGVGIYSTALKNEALSGSEEEFLYEVMVTLNRIASEEMVTFKAHACTDVTGFGLLGHTLEMAMMSNVTIEIDVPSLPLLPGVIDFSKRGFLTGGGMANREFVKEKLGVSGKLLPEMEMLLYDPQTSGGLLVALPAEKGGSYLKSISAKGIVNAALIGEVQPASDHSIVLKI